MAHFKKVTTGHAILMGMRTAASFGAPLKDRDNIVLYDPSRSPPILRSSFEYLPYEEHSKVPYKPWRFYIGGDATWKLGAGSKNSMMLISHMHEPASGDIWFPQELFKLFPWIYSIRKAREFHIVAYAKHGALDIPEHWRTSHG